MYFYAILCSMTDSHIIKEIGAEDAQEHRARNAKVLDVRTESEYARGHIKECIHLDIYKENFSDELQKLAKNETYIVYCGNGGRSGRAVEVMDKLGFKNTHNLIGGITSWKKKRMPVVIE